jgi:hypothetical protein
MKIEGHRNQSAMDCSVKFKNLKRHYLKLSVLRTTKKQIKKSGKGHKERPLWPFMQSMEILLKNNSTVTLHIGSYVTDVVD